MRRVERLLAVVVAVAVAVAVEVDSATGNSVHPGDVSIICR